jgi:hypothetical protein
MDSGYTDPHRDLKSEDEWYAAHLLRQKDKPNPMQVCADCGRDYPEDMTECPFCEVSRVTGEPPLSKDEVKRIFSCIVAKKRKSKLRPFGTKP